MSQHSDHKGIDAFPAKPPRLPGQVRETIRRLHYSRRTEESYVHWIKRFIYWSDKRHPASMGTKEVTASLHEQFGEAKRLHQIERVAEYRAA